MNETEEENNESSNIPTDDATNQNEIKNMIDSNTKLIEKQNKVLGKVTAKLNSIDQKLMNQKRPKIIKLTVPPIDTRSNQQKTLPQIFSSSPRQFIIKSTFKDISKMLNNGQKIGNVEEHCGVPWRVFIGRLEDILCGYLTCDRLTNMEVPWSIDTKLGHKIIQKKKLFSEISNHCYGKHCSAGWRICNWDKLNDYLMDDTLFIEVHVEIKKMTGIYQENLMNFDESNKECSDTVLKVYNQDFYVSKLLLATRSSYFKAMFLGQFQDSTMAEIRLKGIDPEDFQKYLEALHGEYAIDEYTVEGILHIADMYDTSFVIKRCVEFLIEKSKKTPKKMLEMAVRYNLENLKKKVMDGIKTSADIKEVLPGDINDMDKSIMAELFQKLLDSK